MASNPLNTPVARRKRRRKPDPHKLTAKLGGKEWLIHFVRSREIPSDRWGDCGHPDDSVPTIRIRRAVDGINRMDLIIHEALHAIYPDESEEMVHRSATELAALLWASGYRRVEL
jgi:hypothetical protein